DGGPPQRADVPEPPRLTAPAAPADTAGDGGKGGRTVAFERWGDEQILRERREASALDGFEQTVGQTLGQDFLALGAEDLTHGEVHSRGPGHDARRVRDTGKAAARVPGDP